MDFMIDIILDLVANRLFTGKWRSSYILLLGCTALVILGAVLHVSLLIWIGAAGLILSVPIGILLVFLEGKGD